MAEAEAGEAAAVYREISAEGNPTQNRIAAYRGLILSEKDKAAQTIVGIANRNPVTTTLRGHPALMFVAKLYNGQPMAMTFANLTQAKNKAAALGVGWEVYRFGRPFFVGHPIPFG